MQKRRKKEGRQHRRNQRSKPDREGQEHKRATSIERPDAGRRRCGVPQRQAIRGPPLGTHLWRNEALRSKPRDQIGAVAPPQQQGQAAGEPTHLGQQKSLGGQKPEAVPPLTDRGGCIGRAGGRSIHGRGVAGWFQGASPRVRLQLERGVGFKGASLATSGATSAAGGSGSNCTSPATRRTRQA